MKFDNQQLLSSVEYHQGQIIFANADNFPYLDMTVSNYYRFIALFRNIPDITLQ